MASILRHVRAGAAAALVALASVAGGQTHWSRTYGGPAGGEVVHAVAQVAGRDLVIAAATDSFGTGTGDAWLLRLSPNGDVVSQHVAGNALPGGVDGAVVLADGSAVFASRNVRDAATGQDASFVKVASDGSVAWSFDVTAPSGCFVVNDLVARADGLVIGVGRASLTDAGPFQGWMILISPTGSVVRQVQLEGTSGEELSFEGALLANDGDVLVTGWISPGAGGKDVVLAKLDLTGGAAWTQRVGGASDDVGHAVGEVRGGGGYAVAASTDSFTASGHAGWLVRTDSVGALTWTEAIGAGEWSELSGIVQNPSMDFVVVGTLANVTHDMWAASIGQGSATLYWQRRFEGVAEDAGAEVATVMGGDLVFAGTWGVGSPDEDLWVMRTDGTGQIPGCGLVIPTSLTNSAPRYTRTAPRFTGLAPLGAEAVGLVATASSGLVTNTKCGTPGCPTLTCDALTIEPNPACEGTSQLLTLTTSGGMAPVAVTWDLDGNTTPETPGNPVLSVFPPGTTAVRAFASDACVTTPSTCQRSADVVVLSATPPGEVSDVRGGAVPLLVLDRGARISFEARLDAVAYDLYVDDMGSWYSPTAARGSACFIPTAAGTPGRVDASVVLPTDVWLVVTASSHCDEGSAGRDSFGVERLSRGSWPTCGGAP